jgi:Rad3-related DNA helicase
VLQAAGRVIRSAEDKGIILLIGQRFATGRYTCLFPPHWSPKRIADVEHLRVEREGFFKREAADQGR